jgi:hypothetical protein
MVDDKEQTVVLTEAQKKKNEVAKKVAYELMRMGDWDWDSPKATDVANFAMTPANKAVEVAPPVPDAKTFDSTKSYITSGADYRYAYVMMRSLKVMSNMQPDVKKLVVQAYFGQDTLPNLENPTDKEKAIIAQAGKKALEFQAIVAGEYHMRSYDKTGEFKGATTTPLTGTSPNTTTPKPTAPAKPLPGNIGGGMDSSMIDLIHDPEWPDKAMAELREASELNKTTALGSLGLPDSITEVLNAAKLQLSGVSTSGDAAHLVAKANNTEKQKGAAAPN